MAGTVSKVQSLLHFNLYRCYNCWIQVSVAKKLAYA